MQKHAQYLTLILPANTESVPTNTFVCFALCSGSEGAGSWWNWTRKHFPEEAIIAPAMLVDCIVLVFFFSLSRVHCVLQLTAFISFLFFFKEINMFDTLSVQLTVHQTQK